MPNFIYTDLFLLFYTIGLIFVFSPIHLYRSARINTYNAARESTDLPKKTTLFNWLIVLTTFAFSYHIVVTRSDFNGEQAGAAFLGLLAIYLVLSLLMVLAGMSYGLEDKGAREGYILSSTDKHSANIAKLVRNLIESGMVHVDSECATLSPTYKFTPKDYPDFEQHVCNFLDAVLSVNSHPYIAADLSLKSLEADTLSKLALTMTILEDPEKMEVLSEEYLENVTESLHVFDDLTKYIVAERDKYTKVTRKMSKFKADYEEFVSKKEKELRRESIKTELKEIHHSGKSFT